jgi:hypothetical protein
MRTNSQSVMESSESQTEKYGHNKTEKLVCAIVTYRVFRLVRVLPFVVTSHKCSINPTINPNLIYNIFSHC